MKPEQKQPTPPLLQMRPVLDTCHWAQDYFYSASVSVVGDFPKVVGPIDVPKNLTKRRVYAVARWADGNDATVNARLEFFLAGNKVLDLPLEYNLGILARTSRPFAIRFDTGTGGGALNFNYGSQDSLMIEFTGGQTSPIAPINLQIACDKILIRVIDAASPVPPTSPFAFILACLSEGKEALA